MDSSKDRVCGVHGMVDTAVLGGGVMRLLEYLIGWVLMAIGVGLGLAAMLVWSTHPVMAATLLVGGGLVVGFGIACWVVR